MKYIDADRLRMELEKRLKNVRDYMNGAGMRYKGPKFYKARGKESAYDALLNIIISLQQEQPEVFDTVAFQKGVQEGRRLEREEMPKWRNYGPNIIKDPFVTDLGSLVVGEKCIRIYELYNLPGFKND